MGVTYRLKADIENLEDALNPILNAVEMADGDPKIAFKVHLSLEELISNVMLYAYAPETGDVTLSYEIDADKVLAVTIIDEGKPFNPLEAETPDVTLAATDRKIGGLGIFLAKKTMDEITYRRDNNQNLLIVKKRLVA